MAAPEPDQPPSADGADRLLELQGLVHCRGAGPQGFRCEVPALHLAVGEVIALTGESGSGKSTVLELLGLVARPSAPVLVWRVAGRGKVPDLAELWRRNDQRRLARVRARALGFVLQTGGLLPYLTVTGNIQINRRLLGLPPDDEHLTEIINRLSIGEALAKYPHQLSIGQQQRVSIARALAHRPCLVLADEPTSALDPRLGDTVLRLLIDLAGRFGIGVIIATHAQAEVRALGLREVRAVPLEGRFGSRFEDVA